MGDPNETMVENFDDVPADDTLEESITEETDESESLESLNGEEEETPAEEEPKEGKQGASEPGWIRKRVDKAVEKALAEQERRLTAQFEAQMAPIRDKMLTEEAKELVRQGEFKSLERAKEYLQLKQGLPVNTGEEPSQPRSANGQFAPKEDPATTARINMLTHQADRIKASGGPDVVAEFRNNPQIKKAVIEGEMDFYDVAEQMKQPAKRKPPSPRRSPNGANGQNPNAIESMSDEQFRRLEKRIQNGERFRLS
jgi:hypothetical protein